MRDCRGHACSLQALTRPEHNLKERACESEWPSVARQACLSLAFVVEGTLFAFHLEGQPLNVHAHLLLVLCIFAAAGTLLLEMQFPGNVLLGALRAQLVILQGVWFMQIARLLFEGAPLRSMPCHSCKPLSHWSHSAGPVRAMERFPGSALLVTLPGGLVHAECAPALFECAPSAPRWSFAAVTAVLLSC